MNVSLRLVCGRILKRMRVKFGEDEVLEILVVFLVLFFIKRKLSGGRVMGKRKEAEILFF